MIFGCKHDKIKIDRFFVIPILCRLISPICEKPRRDRIPFLNDKKHICRSIFAKAYCRNCKLHETNNHVDLTKWFYDFDKSTIHAKSKIEDAYLRGPPKVTFNIQHSTLIRNY